MQRFIKLRQECIAKDMKHQELARAVGMSKNIFSLSIRGNRPFTIWEIARICDALGISQEDAFTYFPVEDLSAETGKSAKAGGRALRAAAGR